MTHDGLLNILDTVTQRGDKAYVGTGLIVAGFVPNFFSSSTLSAIYFALLIPPAAYHCYLWARKTIYPMIRNLLDKE